MNDPDFNYVYKSSEAQTMAKYVDFGLSIGSGSSFSLPNYYKLCDEIVEALREHDSLLKTHFSRLTLEHYNDQSLHLLAFDLMYCCRTYNFYHGVSIPSVPKSSRKKASAASISPEEAKRLEKEGSWEDALSKYEEASKLNCDYGYTDQKGLSMKITSLYAKAGRTEDGPSVVNNPSVTLADYSQYRFTLQNPISRGKKSNYNTKIVRVSCSDTETRIELETESDEPGDALYIKPQTYIKSKHSDKLRLSSVENITVAPTITRIPWPYQKLRFALIFPALPAEDGEFDLIEPSSDWKFKELRCR